MIISAIQIEIYAVAMFNFLIKWIESIKKAISKIIFDIALIMFITKIKQLVW